MSLYLVALPPAKVAAGVVPVALAAAAAGATVSLSAGLSQIAAARRVADAVVGLAVVPKARGDEKSAKAEKVDVNTANFVFSPAAIALYFGSGTALLPEVEEKKSPKERNAIDFLLALVDGSLSQQVRVERA